MASVLMDPRQKRDSMASGNNRGQKGYLLASTQYASIPNLRQNEKNNRGKKPLLHWCKKHKAKAKVDMYLVSFCLCGLCLRRSLGLIPLLA